MTKAKLHHRSTPDTRKEVWQELAYFLGRVQELTDQALKEVHIKELGFPIGRWISREDIITRIVYVMSKKIIEG